MSEILPPTDLTELAREVLQQPPAFALPSKLTDRWLQLVARDLAGCCATDDGLEEPSIYMAAPLALILHLLLGKGGQVSRMVTFEALERYLREYQLEVNLELVSRLTNIEIEPATLASLFESRPVSVSMRADWRPSTS